MIGRDRLVRFPARPACYSTRQTFERAERQSYVPRTAPEVRSASVVAGLGEPVDLVVFGG